MKKILTLCVVLLIAVSFVSCGKKSAVDATIDVIKKAILQAENAKSMVDIQNVSTVMIADFAKLSEEYKEFVPTEEDEAKLKPYAEDLVKVLEQKTKEFSGANNVDSSLEAKSLEVLTEATSDSL